MALPEQKHSGHVENEKEAASESSGWMGGGWRTMLLVFSTAILPVGI